MQHFKFTCQLYFSFYFTAPVQLPNTRGGSVMISCSSIGLILSTVLMSIAYQRLQSFAWNCKRWNMKKIWIRSNQKPTTTYFYVTTTMYAKLEDEEKLLQSKQATNKTTYLRIHSTHKSQNQANDKQENRLLWIATFQTSWSPFKWKLDTFLDELILLWNIKCRKKNKEKKS